MGGDLGRLGAVLLGKGEFEEAEAMLREAAERSRVAVGGGHWQTARVQGRLGACLTKMGRYEEAEQELLEAHRVVQAAVGSEHKQSIKAIKHLSSLYDAWSKPDKAAEWRAKLPAKGSDKGTRPQP